MSQLFDPLYPTVANYRVSQSIWELYEIHFWQLLFGMWGKKKAFHTLQQRYEKKHYEGRAVTFLIIVFTLSYLIQWLMVWIHTNRTNAVPHNNIGVDHNGPNEANGGAANQQPNPQNNE